MLIALAVGVAIAACGMIYFIFLYIEGFPLGEKIAGKALNDLLEGQFLSAMDLEVEVEPGEALLRGTAKLTFFLPKKRLHALQRRLLFFLPSDLIFFLHPDLELRKVSWGDRALEVKRLKSSVFVDLKGPPPDDGVVILDVSYQGNIQGEAWRSLLLPDLIYLDPQDHYYPNQGHTPCTVRVAFRPPPGFTAVVPGLDDRTVEVRDGGAKTFTFAESVSSFVLAASPAPPAIRHIGEMNYHFYGWEDRVEALAETLVDIQDFYAAMLPPPAIRELRIVKHPGLHVIESRYDETGTILYPSDVSDEDLAYITALFWIKPVEVNWRSLFSPEEIARGLALYFFHSCRGEHLYRKKLLGISRDLSLTGPALDRSHEPRPVEAGGNSWAGPGAYLLSILRSRVGDRAFDEILWEMLVGAAEGEDEGLERWNEVTMRLTGKNLDWLLRRWAGQERDLDLAVVDFEVEQRPVGHKVRLVITNNGSLDLPEKVKVLFITDSGVFSRAMVIPRSRVVFTDYHQEKVTGVVLDPDMEWFDVDRSNNIAYLDPPPYLVMPSEDNRYLAVAYRKRADAATHPLVIFRTDGRSSHVFQLGHLVEELQWISDDRLLVHVVPENTTSSAGPVGPSYLIDIVQGRAERIASGVHGSASDSGRFLLLNEKQGKGFRHRLKDIDKKLTRSILNNVPFLLRWLPGTDLIIPEYPAEYSGDIEIYTPSGGMAYPFSKSDSRLFDFQGFEGGLAFMREKEGSNYFYTIARPDHQPRQLATLTGAPMGFHISKYDGVIYLKESFPDKKIRISSIDPTGEKKELLYEGFSEGMYDVFCQKGLLFKTKDLGQDGRIYQDIQFHRFGEENGRFITRTTAPERVLALVSNQRYLYYAEEIQAPWSHLSTFNTYRFFRYDFLNRENEELELSTWWP